MNPVDYPKSLLQSTWLAEEKALAKVIKGYAAHDLGDTLKALAAAHGKCDLDCFDFGKVTAQPAIDKTLDALDATAAPAVKALSQQAAKVKTQAVAFDTKYKGDKAAKDAVAAAKAVVRDLEALTSAMDAALVNARNDLGKRKAQAAKAAKPGGGKDPLASLPEYKVVRNKVLAGLRAARNPKPDAKPVRFMLAVGARLCMPYVAITVSASHKPLLLALMGDDTSGLKYPQGVLTWERAAYTFVSEDAPSGAAAKLQLGLKRLVGAKLPLRVRKPDGQGEELEGDEDLPDDDEAPDSEDLVARYKSLEQGILATKAMKMQAINDILDRNVNAFRNAMVAKDYAQASEVLDAIDDVVGSATNPIPRTEASPEVQPTGQSVILDELGAAPVTVKPKAELTEEERRKVEQIEAKRKTSAELGAKLKDGMAKLVATDDVDLDKLRKLVDAEFEREGKLNDLLKEAADGKLPIEPSPAKVAFDDNASPGASEWTLAVCAEAFRKYGWFEFKELRKSGAPVQVTGLKEQTRITDDVMWKLYQYRRRFVDQLVAKLHEKYKDSGLLFISSGSEDIESDFDITVASPGKGDDVKAMKDFNATVKAKFGRAPGRVFDTNLYARDYRAIKDNLSKDRPGPAPQDNPIAEPGGDMARMAGIDQDVATLMKQRRFLDGETYQKMWQDLVKSIQDPQEQKRVQKRFEEGEEDYLITAMEKTDAILVKVKATVAKLGPEDPRRKEFEKQLSIYDDARKSNSLHVAQRQMPLLLDLMEEDFPDEVMEVTDEQYARRMGDLRQEQMDLAKLEADQQAHVVDGPDCEAVHKGQSHRDWMAKMPGAIDAKKARIKQAQFINIVFANEAYMSQGAITHIVEGKQAANPQTKDAVLKKITPGMLLQSTNEQMADFFKDMRHMEHVEKKAQGAVARRRATGEAFVHASKYLSRMLEAAALLQDKYKDSPDVLKQLTDPQFDLLKTTGKASAAELQKWVDAALLRLRKSATIPGDAKAELAMDEVRKVFKVETVDAFRKLITEFCVAFNSRVRQLDEFRKAQDVALATEKQYFKPA